VKLNYVDKGYPVILGEYAPTRRSALTGDALTRHLASRAYYLSYVTERAKTYGLVPCYWDNGGRGNLASGIFYRGTGATFDHQALEALQAGAAKGQYPF
jgi:endoglucanase